jgi:tRNA threonylcarbamoyl adenosine modification protein YeaZ
MLILAIDTTGEKGGVGIYRDAACLALVPHEGSASRFSITLFEMVEQALTLAHLELRDIDLYAAANGPGSFTGIRVGLAALRAWGRAFDRPVRGVSVLEAMVYKQGLGGQDSVTASSGPDWYFPILNARRGEFFLGSFRRRHSEPAEANQPEYEWMEDGWVLKPEALRTLVQERVASGANAACIVRAHDQAAADLRPTLPPSLNWWQVEGVLMDSIAAIALRQEQSRRPCAAAQLDAYYIRRPDAENQLD